MDPPSHTHTLANTLHCMSHFSSLPLSLSLSFFSAMSAENPCLVNGKYDPVQSECLVDGRRESVGDKPAVTYKNGTQVWMKNGVIHRDGKPAIKYAHGEQQYWVNGVRMEGLPPTHQ